MLYICTKFCQSISQGFRVTGLNSRVDVRVVTEICKGASFCTKIGRVMELVLSTLCDNALYLYQVLSKYLTGFQSYGPEQ